MTCETYGPSYVSDHAISRSISVFQLRKKRENLSNRTDSCPMLEKSVSIGNNVDFQKNLLQKIEAHCFMKLKESSS